MSRPCDCTHWARDGRQKILTEHHPRCASYDPEGDARKIIKSLVLAMEAWGMEEDGVPANHWDVYEHARTMIGLGGKT